jgi:hypothetical protein
MHIETIIEPGHADGSGGRTIRYKITNPSPFDGKDTILQFEDGRLVNKRGPDLAGRRHSWTNGGRRRMPPQSG